MATSFELSVNRFIKRTEAKAEEIFSKVVVDLFEGAVDLSPIDTGNFVGNWYPSADSFSSAYQKGTSRTEATVKSEIYSVSKNKNMVAYMSNNAPYAELIEEGRSDGKGNGNAWRIAPEGVVNVALKNTKNSLAMGKFK